MRLAVIALPLARSLCCLSSSAALSLRSRTSSRLSVRMASTAPSRCAAPRGGDNDDNDSGGSSAADAPAAAAAAVSSPGPSAAPAAKTIVQYVVLRRDLGWPAGAAAAQAAHASLAAVVQSARAGHRDSIRYVSPQNLPRMTKVVYGVDSLGELQNVRERWNALFPPDELLGAASREETGAKDAAGAGAAFASSADEYTDAQAQDAPTETLYWWVEQPENVPAALATWPVARTNKVSKAIKGLKLTHY